ncbi:hypothetical protein ASG96_19105 [Terrabacter sp. Soil810]|nr:hypothetical protein ASG96_19105 [Terrabacter sp. Soil810]
MQGAIESVDAERFVLERDQREAPQELSEYARAGSYEVSVVGRFHTLAQRWLERQKLAAVWERPVAKRTSGSGRHPTIDISLFGEVAPVNDGDPPTKREVRLEFGFFEIASPKRPSTRRVDPSKLRGDAEKLFDLRAATSPVAGPIEIENYILLWRIANEKNTGDNLKWHHRALTTSANVATTDSTFHGIQIEHLLTSSVDLIAARTNEHRVAYVGVFSVVGQPAPTAAMP